MKATVHYYCAPRSRLASYDAEDIVLTLVLPFVPHIGMDLKLTPEGDFYRVDGVMWDVSEPDELHVYLEEPDELQSWRQMEKQGWRIQ